MASDSEILVDSAKPSEILRQKYQWALLLFVRDKISENTMMPKHRVVQLSLLFIGLCCFTNVAAGQQTTYSFVSVPFIYFGPGATCPPTCRITGSFTVSQPLPPNINLPVGVIDGSGTFTPVSFSFTDGVQTITDQDSTDSGFAVNTDANGNIVQWGFYAENASFYVYGSYFPNTDSSVGFNGNFGGADFDQLGVPTGVWCKGTLAGCQSSAGPFAYVPISSGNVLSVFDLSSNLLVATIPVGASPFDAKVSPNGSFVYVTNFLGGSVSVINASTYAVVATIPVGSFPKGIAITPDNSTVYVAVPGTNVVSVINAATQSVIATVPVDLNPGFLVVTPDGKYVYVTNASSNSVSVINTTSNTVITSIPVGLVPQSIAITPDGKTVYVACPNSSLVFVIDTASNTVIHTIPVSNEPQGISISPDGSTAYVSEYTGAAEAIIDLASNTVIGTVPVGSGPRGSAITPDGASVWQTNLSSTNISVISTANDSVTNFPVSGSSSAVAIGNGTPTAQAITQPLNPTVANQFNFGPHNFTVQYPAGTSFSGVNMTVVAVQASQGTFKQRVAGTIFANATCIVSSGAGGNCVDYQVTCSSANGSAISCPSTSTPTITVKSSFDTQQQIVNPGFLTTPIGTNNWSNIFDSFFLQRIDPTVKGRTKGFSEFVAVELGATNDQGAATLQFLWPLRQEDARTFPAGSIIPASFKLTSIAYPGKPVTDAKTEVSVQMVSDANGNATSKSMLEKPCELEHIWDLYFLFLNTSHYAAGTYVLTVYGDSFAAQQVQFTITPPYEHEKDK